MNYFKAKFNFFYVVSNICTGTMYVRDVFMRKLFYIIKLHDYTCYCDISTIIATYT